MAHQRDRSTVKVPEVVLCRGADLERVTRATRYSVTSHSHPEGPLFTRDTSRTGGAYPLGSTRYFSPVRRAVYRLTASWVSILSRLTRSL